MMMNKNRLQTIIVILVCWLFFYYEYMLRVSDSVIIGDLITAFHIKAAEVSLLSSSYYWVYALMQFPAGLLLDRYSFKLVFSLGITCVALGSMLFGLSDDLTVVIFARVLMGLGSAFSFVGYIKVLRCLVKPKKISLWIGLGMMVAMLGAVSAQAPWLYVINNIVNWKTAYVFAGFFGVGLAMVSALFMPKYLGNTNEGSRPDLYPQFKKIICQKELWFLVIFIALLSSPLTALVAFWAIPFFTHGWGLPKIVAAGAISTAWIGGLFAGPLLGFLADDFQKRKLIMISTAFIAAAITTVLLFVPIKSMLMLGVLIFILGLVCNGVVVVFGMISERVDASVSGLALGWANSIACMSGPFFQMLIGGILGVEVTTTISSLADYSLSEFQTALVVIPALLFLYTLFFIFKFKVERN